MKPIIVGVMTLCLVIVAWCSYLTYVAADECTDTVAKDVICPDKSSTQKCEDAKFKEDCGTIEGVVYEYDIYAAKFACVKVEKSGTDCVPDTEIGGKAKLKICYQAFKCFWDVQNNKCIRFLAQPPEYKPIFKTQPCPVEP